LDVATKIRIINSGVIQHFQKSYGIIPKLHVGPAPFIHDRLIKAVQRFNGRGFGRTQGSPRDIRMFEAFVLVAAGSRKNPGVRRLYDRTSQSRPGASLGSWRDADELSQLLGTICALLVKFHQRRVIRRPLCKILHHGKLFFSQGVDIDIRQLWNQPRELHQNPTTAYNLRNSILKDGVLSISH